MWRNGNESLRTSPMRIAQRNGERTPPCGQPRLTVWALMEPLCDNIAVRHDKKQGTSRTRYNGQPLLIMEKSMAWCHAASNALLMSRKTTAVTYLASRAFSIKDIRAWPEDSVDFPGKKPCWFTLIHLRWLECHWSRDRKTFSRILARLLTRLIGRKLSRMM